MGEGEQLAWETQGNTKTHKKKIDTVDTSIFNLTTKMGELHSFLVKNLWNTVRKSSLSVNVFLMVWLVWLWRLQLIIIKWLMLFCKALSWKSLWIKSSAKCINVNVNEMSISITFPVANYILGWHPGWPIRCQGCPVPPQTPLWLRYCSTTIRRKRLI